MPEGKYALNQSLLNSQWPPRGGWVYYQAETGWRAPSPMSDSFRDTVQRIRAHRMANPAQRLETGMKQIEEDLMQFTALRILDECPEHAGEWLIPIDEEAKKKLPHARPKLIRRLSQGVERVVERVRQDVAGASALMDWLGSGGKPVSTELATARARVCFACPFNQPRKQRIEATMAQAILEQEEARTGLDLHVENEEKLQTCAVCGCHLKLKVWVPSAHLVNDQRVEQLPDWCWILLEKKKAKDTTKGPAG